MFEEIALAGYPSDVIDRSVADMDAWLETMRTPAGYGGPVAHWWQDCLHFTGAGLDWRYEGIISGYLNLYKRTGQIVWLDKAKRAGDDLVAGQQSDGHYSNSSFEANPKPGGTPHEAACDLALIRLTQAIRKAYLPGWEPYVQAAERNIYAFVLGKLWVAEPGYFCNLVDDPVFVPNKAATTVEALLAWIELSGQYDWVDKYILPTLERILSCQVNAPGSELDGAIDQAQGSKLREGWFFPFYNARCIPALIQGYQLTGHNRYLKTANRIMDFILRVQFADGSFPQVLSANRRIYRYPQWVAGVGDILRAMRCLEGVNLSLPKEAALVWLLHGQLPSGGIRTAKGFANKNRWPRLFRLPDFRDLLPSVGWVDKAFFYLSNLVGADFQPLVVEPVSFETPCQYVGKRGHFYEDALRIEMYAKDSISYRWKKGAVQAEVSF
jgi:hypothetical protein